MMYISIDTETGGLGRETSLLSLGIVIADENFNIQYEEEVLFKPKDGKYIIEPAALAINKINLVELDKNGIDLKIAGSGLYKILNNFSSGGKDKLVPVGKNTLGDLARIWDNLLSRGTWETFCSYRIVDISSVCQFLKDTMIIPTDVGGSLDSLREYFRVINVGTSHAALDDARDTLVVYKQMVLRILYKDAQFDQASEKIGKIKDV
jgi:hypothetical protein